MGEGRTCHMDFFKAGADLFWSFKCCNFYIIIEEHLDRCYFVA